MNVGRITNDGNQVTGIVSSGFTVLDRSTGRFVPYVRPGQFRPSTSLIPRQTPLPRSRSSTVAQRKTPEQIRAEGQARLDAMRRASDERIRKRQAQIAEQRRQVDLARQRKAAEAPPDKRAGIRAWEAYYARRGVVMPATARATKERDDQTVFYKAVAGKKYIQKQQGINPRPGVGWMFSVAYDGQTMPYWDAWYNRSMSASQIAARVAADYTAEIQRRIQVQAQNIAARELWQDTGKQGPRPIPSKELLPTLPAMPRAPERRISPPLILRRPAFEELPAFQQSIPRGRVWEELPPLMRGLL